MEGESSRNEIKCIAVFLQKRKKKVHYYKCKVPFASIVLATALQKAKLVYLEIRGKRIRGPPRCATIRNFYTSPVLVTTAKLPSKHLWRCLTRRNSGLGGKPHSTVPIFH